jgi:hypothetical protein
MGLFGKKENEEEKDQEELKGKYNEPCSLCNKAPTDKKWGGQYFHKKCFRKLRKTGSKML